MDVKTEVLKKIKPSHEESEKVKRFVQQLLIVSKTVSGLDGVIVGSIGKFTWLAGDHDIDLFLMFDGSVPREELERLGLEYGKRIVQELGGKSSVKYAEHPYTSATIRGYDVDIVPCYRIKYGEKIKSAVDRSPLHLRHVLDYIKPAMIDEVRLLKQFCKGIGAYGSDAKNQGFSGYICELLVLQYGSFDAVISAAGVWKPPHIINTERHLGVPLHQFKDQPLVIIDPVDAGRNVAAVVNGENFMKFVTAAKNYSDRPSAGFFFPRPKKPLSALQFKSLQNRGTKFIAVRFSKPDIIDDILYPQLRRTMSRLVQLLEHHEFHVLRACEFAENQPTIIIELEVWSLPSVKKMTGPPIFSEKHTEEFLAKYSKGSVYVHDNRWVAEVQRKHKTAVSLVNDFLNAPPPVLAERGVPKYLAPLLTKKKAMEKEFWKLVKKDKPLSDYMRQKYFSGVVSESKAKAGKN